MFTTLTQRIACGAALLGLGLMPALPQAASKTASFEVSLKLVADCTIAASPLDFGQSNGVLNTVLNVNTTLSITCSNTTPYSIGLDGGSATGSTVAARHMSGTGANTGIVSFYLYQTAGATNWGNTQGTDTRTGTGNGVAQTLTVYGVVPAQTTPAPDTYKSTITATVYF